MICIDCQEGYHGDCIESKYAPLDETKPETQLLKHIFGEQRLYRCCCGSGIGPHRSKDRS